MVNKTRIEGWDYSKYDISKYLLSMILLHDMVNRQTVIIIMADVLLHSHSVYFVLIS